MKFPDHDECMQIGLALIEEHGENVGPFIRSKIDALWGTDNYEEIAKWLAIQNAAGFVVNADQRNFVVASHARRSKWWRQLWLKIRRKRL